MRRVRTLDLREPQVIEAEKAANQAWSVFIIAKQIEREIREYVTNNPVIGSRFAFPSEYVSVWGAPTTGKSFAMATMLRDFQMEGYGWWQRFLVNHMGFEPRRRPLYVSFEGPQLRQTFGGWAE